ncbi:MAG: GIY-YIG nuclease family protein [Candidatus Berkelbacteria bacterium]|nr:GIY-YIG nuclease family protein [Candidatus Berkelbacteria bacterium]
MKNYYVYIVSSNSKVLYIGMTNSLERRICEHKAGLVPGFTQKYKCKNLVYFESSNNVNTIIAREKQLKKWNRLKKINLIEKLNPKWEDLSTSSR